MEAQKYLLKGSRCIIAEGLQWFPGRKLNHPRIRLSDDSTKAYFAEIDAETYAPLDEREIQPLDWVMTLKDGSAFIVPSKELKERWNLI